MALCIAEHSLARGCTGLLPGETVGDSLVDVTVSTAINIPKELWLPRDADTDPLAYRDLSRLVMIYMVRKGII